MEVKRLAACVQLSIQQLISQAAAEATSHEEFVAYVAQLVNQLSKSKVITNEEAKGIRLCAAKSTIGD